MTDHSATTTIGMESGILLANAGLRNGISVQSDMHLFLNASWISVEINMGLSFSNSANVYPPLTFHDSDGNRISKIMFESVYPGRKTGVQTITMVNKTDNTLTVTLSSIEGIVQSGSENDTYGSVLLSDDNDIFYKTLTLEIPANDTLDFYIYYQPPSTAIIGEKEWALHIFPANLNDWLYYNTFTVTNNTTDTLTDTIISITLPHTSTKMETDFKDIRFYTETEELESSIDYKYNSNYAVFNIRIPILEGNEVLTVYMWSGNSYALVNDDNVFTENWNWEDGLMGDWEEVIEYPHSHTYVAAWSDWDYAMELSAGSNPTAAEAPSSGAYGRWTMRYQFYVTYASVMAHVASWYFVHDGTNYYKLVIDNANYKIKLYRNATLLDSAAFNRSTSVHLLTIERTLDGTFTVSVDNTLYLSATDNTITTSIKEYLHWNPFSYTEKKWYIDYIQYTEYLEDPPTISSLSGFENRFDFECYAGILYISRELPELEPELRYSCQVEGDYYE